MSEEITSDDKLWAALSWIPYLGWILAIIALVVETQKTGPLFVSTLFKRSGPA